MEIYKKYWIVTPKIKITYKELFEDVKTNLSDWEAKLVWYLRHLPSSAAFSFCTTAEKLFKAHQARLELNNILD